jgi:hypothetical protein
MKHGRGSMGEIGELPTITTTPRFRPPSERVGCRCVIWGIVVKTARVSKY